MSDHPATGGGTFAIAGCVGHPTARMKSGHATVNGISVYYELHGDGGGTPLVLLHGGGSTIEVTYGRALPLFARRRRVIALDEQNHGRTGHREIPERFTTSADDVAGLLDHLGVEKADVMGFSNGANVAMHVALRHRGLVRKLIFASAMTKRSGAPPEFWAYIDAASFEEMPQPLKDAFLKVNPDPAKLRDMYEKDIERMRNFVETSDDEVRSISIPTLVISGDRDVPTVEHAAELKRLMPQARVMILPGGHGDYLGELVAEAKASHQLELTVAMIEEFLDSAE